MPEIKHSFTTGKMNKDLDERLVRPGEYRDALNVQIRTTDGGADGVGDYNDEIIEANHHLHFCHFSRMLQTGTSSKLST